MNNTNKEELTEMLFKLIEDIGHTEELIEEQLLYMMEKYLMLM